MTPRPSPSPPVRRAPPVPGARGRGSVNGNTISDDKENTMEPDPVSGQPEAITEAEPRKCGDFKRGGVDLRCVLLPGHAEGPEASWHAATCTEHRTVETDGERHEIHIRETVTWKPVDHIREAVRHIMAGREDQP